MKDLVFVSSVQKEVASERQAVRDFVRNDALLHRYFDVFLFEELPARDQRADKLYLDYVDRSAIYLGRNALHLGSQRAHEGLKRLSEWKGRIKGSKGSLQDVQLP